MIANQNGDPLLSRCPFCGGEANYWVDSASGDKYFASCEGCDAESGRHFEKADVANAWNARFSPSEQKEPRDAALARPLTPKRLTPTRWQEILRGDVQFWMEEVYADLLDQGCDPDQIKVETTTTGSTRFLIGDVEVYDIKPGIMTGFATFRVMGG